MPWLRLSLLDRWLAPAPDPARVAWLKGWTYAHRGLHGPGAVENSPAAFRAAIEAGMGIECDIQRTLDDVPMVFHDWDLARLLGRSEAAGSCPASEWRTLRYADGESPVDLAGLLDLVAGRVPLLIEIKSRHGYDVEKSCHGVARALEGYRGPHAVMSFDPRVGHWFRRHAPAVVRGLVVTEQSDRGVRGALRRRLALWRAAPDFMAYDVRDLPSRFAAAQRARGLPLLTWTIRQPALRPVAEAHADAAIAEGEGVALETARP